MTRRCFPLASLALALALLGSACALPHLPHLTGARVRMPPLPQTSMIFDDHGRLITQVDAGENRTIVPLSEVPTVLQDAVIAIEDQRFWQHGGIDLRAVARAAVNDARSGQSVEGASTIPEQLAKIAVTGDERTLTRKLKDAVLALRLEKAYSKPQILAMYLNTVYFGQGAYGVQAAAETYFSRPLRRVTLAEAATLAGLIEAPSDYDPLFHAAAARARRNQVLAKMRSLGMIPAAAADRATATPLGLRPATGGRYPAPYFVDYVEQWFLSDPAFGATYADRYRMLFEGGLRIYTTVDLKLQAEAENAVSSVLVERRDPYGAMTVIDPKTGEIRAMVGGRNYFSNRRFSKLNLATGGATGRPAGSAFKPFALVTALQRGISPQQVFAAPSSLVLPVNGGPAWSVSNFDNVGYGAMTLQQATIDSVNTVYAQLSLRVGAANIAATAHKMGIMSPLRAVPSITLGTNPVNTLEMADAYGTLANEGTHIPATAVTRITDASGKVLYRADPAAKVVVNPAIAYATDQILQQVIQYGTGTAANIGRPAGGKTGTTENYSDAWFVGFTPQLVAAVWVGFPRGEIPMVSPRVRVPQVLGGTWPAQIWRVFMVNALRGVPEEGFPKPQGDYVRVAVDITRGCLPNQYTPLIDIRVERFAIGTQPTEVCTEPTSPQPLDVPSVIGLTLGQAKSTLLAVGFKVQVVREATQAASPGTVLVQSPAPGVIAIMGATITLTVAAAPSG